MILVQVLTRKGNSFEVKLPSKVIVCPDCNGSGTELCGGLKGAVISDESLEDPDFCRSYFGGDYDVACSRCNGRNVIDAVDEERLSKKMLERYYRQVESDARYEAEERAERRFWERAYGER